MYQVPLVRFGGSLLLACGVMLSVVHAQGSLPIHLEVAIEPGASLTAPQEWSRVLGRINLANVRIRQLRPDDQPRINIVKTGKTSRFEVTAILSSRDQLVLPDRSFRAGQRTSVQTYFQQLPAQTEHTSVERGRFDLTEPQFNKIYAEFSKTLSFETAGLPLRELLTRVRSQLTTPTNTSTTAISTVRTPLVTVELKGLSLGTALAIALREHDLVVRPEQRPGQSLRFVIERYEKGREYWPAGWKPEKSVRQLAPPLYERLTIEANKITLGDVLAKLEPKLQMPIVLDQYILTRRDISVEQIPVKMARRKTYLKGAIDRLASQAKLATEVRVDEREQPFLWITQFGKDSPPAAE